jgi:hypothetical protein
LGWWNGLTLTNAADASTDVTCSTGQILDTNGDVCIDLKSAITKEIDNSWSEGDGLGGFPSTGITLSTGWYRFFLIMKQDGTVDAGFDTAQTATNLLADATGYSYYRRVGWIYYNSGIQNWVINGERE